MAGNLLEELSESYKAQVMLSTSLMVIVPFTTFFTMRSHLRELWVPATVSPTERPALDADVDTWSAIAAVVAVQAVILLVLIAKYRDDILDVFCRNRGHLHYTEDGSLTEAKPEKLPKEETMHQPLSWKIQKKGKAKRRHLH